MNTSALQNKTVWITGASSGIGEYLVGALAKLGANVVLSARNETALQQVVEKWQLAPEKYLILPLDLSLYTTLGNLPQKVLERFGRLDVLINNGGISQRSYFVDTDISVFTKIMDTNFMGAVALTKASLPFLTERNESSVVAVTSVVGKYGTPLRTAYAASKHAMHGFYDALRAEMHDKGLHVLLVCPGYVKTNLSLNALLGDGTAQGKMDPGQASGITPEYCANQIVKGLLKGKNELYIGGFKEVGGVYLKRFFPKLFASMVRKINVR